MIVSLGEIFLIFLFCLMSLAKVNQFYSNPILLLTLKSHSVCNIVNLSTYLSLCIHIRIYKHMCKHVTHSYVVLRGHCRAQKGLQG